MKEYSDNIFHVHITSKGFNKIKCTFYDTFAKIKNSFYSE